MKGFRKQSGHAAILFAMIIPGLFGLFTLASDGARAIQTKARIEDASEIAVLAIAAHNDDNKNSQGSGSGSSVNRKIATDYLEAYLHDIDSLKDLKIHKYNCDQIPECVAGLARGEPRFFQYEVEATSRHISWFPGGSSMSGFGKTFSAKGAATARKYQSEAVDIVFASDYSGSMGWDWNGGSNKKYIDLRNIIKIVTDELQKFNDLNNGNNNKVGLTGFNYYTQTKPTNRSYVCLMSQLVYNSWGGLDANATKNSVFREKDNNYCVRSYAPYQFKDLALTDNYNSFNNSINKFRPDSSTASYQGIIRGAQMLKKGDNPRRLLIVLSDGADSDSTLRQLVNVGMCTKIKQGLSTGQTSDGQNIKARLAVVGFDYNVNNNTALRDCAGAENVFKAQNTDDILNKILELITEEIGHLK